jgi:hypothetical protein
LITVTLPGLPMGPTNMRVAETPRWALPALFAAGEVLHHDAGLLHGARCTLDARGARCWQARPLPVWPGASVLQERLDSAAALLHAWRSRRPNALDREAAAFCAALGRACRQLDAEGAVRSARRLVGWGEGLTPAGDDFIVGLLAGLDAHEGAEVEAAPAGSDAAASALRARRHGFRAALAAAVLRDAGRTVDIAAHQLRLAAAGYLGETMIGLRNALLGEPDAVSVARALESALALGATSGADMASGLLVGLAAWQPGAWLPARPEGH